MSKLVAVRLQEKMVSDVDRERKRVGLTRTAAIQEALELWVAKRRYEEAVRQDQAGYAREPVDGDEFASLLGAQVWPK